MKEHHGTSRSLLKRTLYWGAAAIFVLLMPTTYVFADGASTTPAASTSCVPVMTPPSGIQQPNGADALTYTYNSCTGLWENPYYTWNPVTKVATPITPYIYTCDTSTWSWDYKQWVYSPSRGTFIQVAMVTGQLPDGALIAADSLVPCAPAAAASISDTGPGSTNTATTNTTGKTTLGNTTTAALANQIGSTALSGDAIVTGNTLGGNATTGNAQAMATVINALQSSTSLTGAPVATFTANINGDVQGNLIIDPSKLQPAVSANVLVPTDLTVNNATSGQINNNISLAAASGNASVTNNTTGGNATSGNAEAIANVVNMLNSMITAGQSFIGVVNINGNLNGDILMPQSFLDNLIASNAPSTTLSLDPSAASSLGIASTNNLSTTNTLTNTAASGAASVTGNTAGGSAASGNANTSVRVFNLTGNQVVGKNCLLLFVNVEGTWVGVIMNAPAGATAAAFGSGVSSSTAGSVTNTTNDAITNNIDLSAVSGGATVANNTAGGSAASGNADTAANLLNMNNTGFSLSGWFGVLFINIFGNWYGNLGIYDPPVAQPTAAPLVPPAAPDPPKVFRFVPTTALVAKSTADDTPLPAIGVSLVAKTGSLLADSTHAVPPVQANPTAANRWSQGVSGLLVTTGIILLITEQLITRRRAQRTVS